MAEDRLQDLTHMRHRDRNAVENYEHLTRWGVPHEQALARVGHTGETWSLMADAAAKRADRARRRTERRSTA